LSWILTAAWCQVLPEDLEKINAAREQYEAGRLFERQGNVGHALDAYRSADAALSRTKPMGPGDLPDLAQTTSLRKQYATAAILASSAALDEARALSFLARGKTDEYQLALVHASDNAIVVLESDDPKTVETCESLRRSLLGKDPLSSVFVWRQAPSQGDKLMAYLNLGRTQLMRDDLQRAKNCFQNALAIDRSNSEALANVSALSNILAAANAQTAPSSCACLSPKQKALIAAGISIGAALLTERYPKGAPIAASVLLYINSILPEKDSKRN